MKKIEVEPLPSFIMQRLTHVVYCNISTELVRAQPRCFSRIRRAWKKITKENNLNIRIYFPAISFNSKSINSYLSSSKLIFNSREKGFYFDAKDTNTQPNRELQTTQYLRQVMYETDFLQTGNFFDLPISVMFFSLGTEQPVTRKFPMWAQYTIDQASGIHAIYEEAKLEEILQAFIIRSLKSRLDRLVDNARADYLNKKDFINFRRVIDAEACKGNHKAAYVQVKELLKSPNIPVEIQTSSIFLKIELEIILGEISNDTINDILQCIEYSPTYEWRLLAILIHFWISFKMSKPTTSEIERYIISESPINLIVRPFLLEQISIFKGKSLPLTLMQASELHRATGNEEHCLRCYWRAYNSISSTNLYDAKNYLLHSIVSTLFHEKPESAALMSPYLGELLKETHIQKAPITATYLALTEPTEVFECNFIKVSLIDVSFDSPITGPSNYEEDWYQTAIRLFSFKTGKSF
ncbi:hypothetical protein TVAG_321790 [Trichomonas vaginalis G3]|uniref:Uncharacterized protein n=1 Tax=Trichomonas vaginalis (strain ATCC PRA-98 / G3) TaxID=412133 RepID=A2FQF7_TRIV3|nr:hypothetical protein TVAG_321790 [Trichomonas vaginalis G3]|eukprot:XP_001305795.1 hypothetical protein [Trichomonas vaginalis G3]